MLFGIGFVTQQLGVHASFPEYVRPRKHIAGYQSAGIALLGILPCCFVLA
jgi:hypothetical protein